MLERRKMLQILAVHAAVQNDVALQNALIASAGNELPVLRQTWQAIGANACLRRLARGVEGGVPLDFSQFEQRGDTFFWQGQGIGKLLTLYKPPLPEEWQARIAYESFLDRFVIFAQTVRRIFLLYENDFAFCFFDNVGITLDALWKEFIEYAFSESELLKTFVLMLNSIDIGDSFHDIDIPLVTNRQGKILAAYFFAFHRYLKAVMERRERRIREIEVEIVQITNELSNHNLPVDREKSLRRKLEHHQKEIERIRKELVDKQAKHLPSLKVFEDVMNSLALSENEKAELRQLSHMFTSMALSKLTARPDSVQRRFRKIPLLLHSSKLYDLPILLTTKPADIDMRSVGDLTSRTCYVCGRKLAAGEQVKGNKIVLSSPSQTPQSGSSQKTTQPVCGVCANLAFISPIKFGGNSFVVRLREKSNGREYRYLFEDQLRMFVLGELNVYAGRYVMVTCSEKIGKDTLLEELSKEPYALWKVATVFPASVFRSYLIEAVIDGALIVLPSRHLAWLSALMEIFYEIKVPYRLENDKSKLVAVKKALRHIQHEEVIFAIYELTKALMAEREGGFTTVQASRLEDLRALHVWWLENDPFAKAGRRFRMGDLMNKARFFRDVAGMTGLLYAFATRVRSEANPQNAEREVEKLLEKVDEPNHFIYEAAGGLKSVSARLWREPATH